MYSCRVVKILEGLAAVAAAVAGDALHLAESSASLSTGNISAANTAQVASRAWIMLLRPCLQLVVGVLWSISVWLAVDGEVDYSLLHPLVAYLVPTVLGSISVWFALD